MTINKAVITAAGMGTRFLPVAKAYQKEMVPILNKPQHQVVIEEAIESGINQIAIVVRKDVNTFRDYLAADNTLWAFLKANNKEYLMDSWIHIKQNSEITIFEQSTQDPYGNGTPFILAKDFVGNDPFVAMWGDDIIIRLNKNIPTVIEQLSAYYEKYKPFAVMSAYEVSYDEISKYGAYEYYSEQESIIPFRAKGLIEKPEPANAPSLMANACRFILTPEVIEELSRKISGKDNEIWLTDSVERMIKQGKLVLAPTFKGSEWIPVGDPERWLKANILSALVNPTYASATKEFIKSLWERYPELDKSSITSNIP